ncbi:Solute carrier family 28 member 3 [Pseudolycoriella hygida]|uniref:Sodium/nucleoside cotransporter n=1 Tax=Pseudolycoriella hygida TaxID=35572 RepID=A0A9Q0N0G1_9DIPT|nr:Solute carrier family 28 member 3 [Pseudolycoriella hygida]
MIGIDNKGYDNEGQSNKTIEDAENLPRTSALDRAIVKLKFFKDQHELFLSRTKIVFINVVVIGYFAWATSYFFESKKLSEISNNVKQSNETEPTATTCGQQYCGIQWCDGYGMLIILLAFTYAGLLLTKIILIGVTIAAFATFLAFDTIGSRSRLQSLIGITVLLAFGFVFSAHPKKIRLRPVICGFALQLLLGVLCIRWEVGRSIFKCLGDKAAKLLSFSTIGSTFVYGKFLSEVASVFAFAVLPVIFFVSFLISILYYLGAMQWIILKLGWLLQTLIGTTICESLTCSANIFLGMSESPLLIKPYIKYLTRSEIHVVMSSGFATVSGTVLAAYISYGAEPAHLVTSSVMAAPAALCFAKLFYPETEESKTDAENIQLEKSTDSSILDAASNGANAAISLILGICANIIAFVAFVAFLNAFVSWLFVLVGLQNITFEWIFSKVFIPLAWIIGVEWEDCESVAKLIATKTIINEFVAYEQLGKMKAAEEISLRSAGIATFAVCGFANPSSLGIMIGALSAMCPEKRPDITSVAVRAFISGCIICFLNASIAALLMSTESFEALSNNRTLH